MMVRMVHVMMLASHLLIAADAITNVTITATNIIVTTTSSACTSAAATSARRRAAAARVIVKDALARFWIDDFDGIAASFACILWRCGLSCGLSLYDGWHFCVNSAVLVVVRWWTHWRRTSCWRGCLALTIGCGSRHLRERGRLRIKVQRWRCHLLVDCLRGELMPRNLHRSTNVAAWNE